MIVEAGEAFQVERGREPTGLNQPSCGEMRTKDRIGVEGPDTRGDGTGIVRIDEQGSFTRHLG